MWTVGGDKVKLEIRSTKYETNTKFEIQKTKHGRSFLNLKFEHLNLLRISIFRFRIFGFVSLLRFCYNSVMTWASRRRLLYGLAVLFVFLSIFGYTLFLKLYRPPSCVDGVQNQKEIGIDCEGPCSAVCPEHVQEPLVLWTRTFKASSGVFNAVAYIENPNGVFGNQQAAYLFKLYDDAGGLVKEIRGSTYILPNE